MLHHARMYIYACVYAHTSVFKNEYVILVNLPVNPQCFVQGGEDS